MDLETKLHVTRQERIKFLFNHSKAGAYSSMICGAIIFVALSIIDQYSHLLLAWSLCLVVFGGLRLLITDKFITDDNSLSQAEKQFKTYSVLIALAGFTWGLIAFHSGNSDVGHTHSTMIISLLAIAFVATVALPSLAAVPSIYLIFLTSLSISAITGMLLTRGVDGIYLAIALLMSSPLLLMSSRRLEINLTESLWLQHEFKDLLEDLNSKNERLETLNSSLQETQDIFDQEEEVARHVFNQLIHSSEDAPDHCKYWMKPMMSFSGDIIQMAHGPADEEYILLGDFTGHGLPAALGAVPTSAIFKTMAHKGLPVHVIAEELNRKLCELLPTGYFCCAVVMKVSPERDSATIWNGGLPEIIITNQKHGLANMIPSDQLPLGIQPTEMSADDTINITLNNDDFIYIYSDGVTEVENSSSDMLGSEAFKRIISRPAMNNSRLDMIKMAVLSFADGAPASDDISLIEYRCIKNKTASSRPELEATN